MSQAGQVAPLSFSKSDIAASNKLEAGWFPLELTEVTSGQGKKNAASITWAVKFAVAGGEMVDTPVQLFINSAVQNQVALGATLIKAFAGENFNPTREYQLTELVGHKVEGWCAYEDGEFAGNKVKDFRPIGSGN